MDYIRSVSPLPNYYLEVMMMNGSFAVVDFKPRLNSAKYMILRNQETFKSVKTDGNYVIWQDGLVKATAREILEVILAGE